MSRLMKMAAVVAVVLGATLGAARNARAHVDPADVAARCVARVDRITERCQDAVTDDTLECVVQIELLLRAGREDAARELARQCLKDGRETVRIASAEIFELCSECIRYLASVGANQLARRVHERCESSLERLDTLLERQQQILADALAG